MQPNEFLYKDNEGLNIEFEVIQTHSLIFLKNKNIFLELFFVFKEAEIHENNKGIRVPSIFVQSNIHLNCPSWRGGGAPGSNERPYSGVSQRTLH